MAEQPLDRLGWRRREQLRRVIGGESVQNASLAVGYSNRQSGYSALSDTRRRLQAALEQSGMTPLVFVRDYLLPKMNATETKLATFEGKFTDSVEVEALGTQMDAIKLCAKVAGYFPQKEDNGPTHLAITINNTICEATVTDEDEDSGT